MWYDIANLFRKYPLGIKVVVWLIIFSGLLATLSSGIQSWMNYQDGKRLLEQQLDGAAKIFDPILSRSLWHVNNENTKDLLQGILNLPDVYNVILASSDQTSISMGADPAGQPSLSKVYSLYHNGAEQIWLGNLTLIATLEPTRQLVVDRFFTTLIEQLIKTILVAVFLLIAFRHLVSRHLEKMSRYARSLDMESPVSALTLDRKEPAVEDELSQVVNAINTMRVRVLEQSSELRISERQADSARDEAVRENQQKSQFIANISHEFRIPMNDIVGYTELLLDNKLEAEQREFLTAVQKSSESLLSMINDMLDLSRLETGGLESSAEPLEIRALLQEVNGRLAKTFKAKEMRIETYIDAGLPSRIAADYQNLLRILECLLSVAMGFTSGGHIAIHVQPIASVGRKVILRFSIEDNGEGLQPEDVEKILANSFELATAVNLPEPGIGLKLAVAKLLIVFLGGQFGVESEEGKGTTFWFETDAEFKLPEASDRKDEIFNNFHRILLADTSESELNSILDLFSMEEKKQIDIARSMAEVFFLLGQATERLKFYDAFILSDNLGSGEKSEMALFAVLRSIRREAEHRKKPVVVVSGQPDYEMMKKVQSHGASAYLSKFDKSQNLREILVMLLSDDASRSAFTLSTGLMQGKEKRKKDRQSTSVLLVEDNAANRNLAKKMLEKCGCRVTAAENGEQAISRLDDEVFDIIFMDCWMPVMDGYEATKLIRSTKQKNSNTPIVALTANAFSGEKAKCLKIGMNRFLTKPVRYEDYASVVKDSINGILDQTESAESNQVHGSLRSDMH